MKKKIFLLLSIIMVIVLFYIAVNKIVIHNTIVNQYSQSVYSMPSNNINGVIYLDNNILQKIDLEIIPICLKDNEISHGIKYRKPVKIIICKDDQESGKIFKLFKTKASGFAFSDDLIIINYVNLYRLGYTFESIIRHESSHTLLKQNIESFFTKIVTFSNRSLWFSEGFALYNQGLVIYTKDELRQNIEEFSVVYDSESDNFGTIPRNNRYDYSLYFYFMDYLINKYGKDKMLVFLSLMIENYRSSEKSFEIVFESTIRREVLDFLKGSFDKDLI